MLISLLPMVSYAKPDKVAKVIILRGKVQAKTTSNDIKQLKKGMWLAEGTTVKTSAKSFVKLLFIDKSQMNLGPKSEMKITTFPKKKAGIITLMQGQLRSKVTKDYMGIQNKNKSKLFIKTKTAAMGVRGTDFQVSFNRKNLRTALVTFEGAVAMAQIQDTMKNIRVNQRNLELIVSSDHSVIVRQGQYSGVSPKQLRATTPVKINPGQLKVMEKNDGSQVNNSAKKSNQNVKKQALKKRNFRNVVPPGVNAKAVASKTDNLNKAVATTLGTRMVKQIDAKVRAELNQTAASAPPPEGMMNRVTGQMAPTAGGYVDLKTALYIPPPKGSSYDPNTETYIPPKGMGGFDAKSGRYVEPAGMKLTDEGKFVAKKVNFSKKGGRGPASLKGEKQSFGAKPVMELTTCFDCGSSSDADSYDEFGNLIQPTNEQYQELADESLHDFANDYEDTLEQNIIDNTTRVKFIFNSP